jgi:hypothetical protein
MGLTRIGRWWYSPEYIDELSHKLLLSVMFPHIPLGQPGFDDPGCPSESGTETFVLGLGMNPCLLSMLPVTRVSFAREIIL